ncbi:MAG: DUF2232 domain-containing protein [Candidatus Cloacimonetes bacterium]|nr:DUF2232 domain-containing protein [Candidatus Cloacimonadota bacterium]
MLLIVVIAGILSALSPFLGLIFIFAAGGKYQELKSGSFLVMFLAVMILFRISGILDNLTMIDLIIGVGITGWFFFKILFRTSDYQRALLGISGLNFAYAILRQNLFKTHFIRQIDIAIAQYQEILIGNGETNNGQITLEILDQAKNIYVNYFPGLWCFTIIIAAYLGALLFSRKTSAKWEHKRTRMPFFLVYLLITALIFYVFVQTRQAGVNVLLMLAPLFLIQGISILFHYWGNFFTKSRFLLYLLIVAVMLNPYLLLLIILMGMFDIWFNFRKI